MDRGSGRRRLDAPPDCSRADAFVLQENGRLRWEARASLWLSEVRQENAFTEAGRLAFPTRRIVSNVLCGSSAWHRGPKVIGRVALVQSPGSCLRLPWLRASPSFSDRCAGWMWQDERCAAPGHPDFRRQYVEVLPLAQTQPEAKPPARPPRAVRSHQSFRWQDRLARNDASGPLHLRVTVAGVPACLAVS